MSCPAAERSLGARGETPRGAGSIQVVRQAVREQVEQGPRRIGRWPIIDLSQYRRFQGYSRAMEMAVRRVYRELTAGLD